MLINQKLTIFGDSMKYFKVWMFLFYTLVFSVTCQAHTGVKQIEKKYGVKIGVYAIDTNNNNVFNYRQNERFPFQSTVKIIVSAAALKNIDAEEKIKISSDDIVFWSPIIRLNLNRGYMTVGELSEASTSYSDNAANNILIRRLGGIKSIHEFATKSLNMTSFNLDNFEPKLNSDSDNIQDTSTPKDMAQSIQKILLENSVLSIGQQQKLKDWMSNNTTGYTKIRSGLPVGWHAAEKTGGGSNIANDIGIIWSPSCKPIVLAIYTISNKKNNQKQDESIKLTTKLILNEFSKNNTCFAAMDLK
ncbi:MAG: class A beta-lactamase [Candidatus Comchoanobacterales bacterium]